jgi:hypothetical protein
MFIEMKKVAGNSNIGQSNSLPNQESSWKKVVVQSCNDLLQIFLGFVSSL